MGMILDVGAKSVMVSPKATVAQKTAAVKTLASPTTKTGSIPTVLSASPSFQIQVTPVKTGVTTADILKPAGYVSTTVGKAINKVVIPNTQLRTTAITALVNAKMGMQLRALSPNLNKVFTTIQTKQTLANISKAGMELAPKGTKEAVYTAEQTAQINQDAYKSLYGQYEVAVQRQTEYANRQSELLGQLAQGTVDYTTAVGQLSNLQGQYGDLMAKYQDLLNNPPKEPGLDIFGGIGSFLSKYGLWIALGVGAIILLPSILKIFDRGK